MRTVAYRRATLRDLDALLALERDFPGDRLSRRGFRHLLTNANAEVYVGVANDRVIGNAVVLYRNGAKCARLYSIVVASSARGCGVATALIRAVEAAARRRGAERVCLEVRTDNAAAIRLYEKLGYRATRRIKRYYDDGQDALRFEGVVHASRRAALAA